MALKKTFGVCVLLGTSACGFLPDSVKEAAEGVAGSLGGHKDCRAEVPMYLKSIKMAEEIYNSENDAYLQVTSHPSAVAPGKKAQQWGMGNSGFNNLNWHPDGNVKGVYSVSTTAVSSSTPGGDFQVTGRIDCDGDGVEATYTATKSLNVMMTTPNTVY